MTACSSPSLACAIKTSKTFFLAIVESDPFFMLSSIDGVWLHWLL